MRRLCPLLIVFSLAAGCKERPQAPALRDEPVYDNPLAGLRFLAPNNWTQVARSDKPPPGAGERLLVRFQAPPSVTHAFFEVTVDDQPATEDIVALLRQPSHSAAGWEPIGTPTPLTVGGTPATRYTLKSKETTKESVAVRRDGRLFLFTLIAPASDAESREQIRQVISGVKWTK